MDIIPKAAEAISKSCEQVLTVELCSVSDLFSTFTTAPCLVVQLFSPCEMCCFFRDRTKSAMEVSKWCWSTTDSPYSSLRVKIFCFADNWQQLKSASPRKMHVAKQGAKIFYFVWAPTGSDTFLDPTAIQRQQVGWHGRVQADA